jgi:hypothetical protein
MVVLNPPTTTPHVPRGSHEPTLQLLLVSNGLGYYSPFMVQEGGGPSTFVPIRTSQQ